MEHLIRRATEEFELEVRRLTLAYQQGLEVAQIKYALIFEGVFTGSAPAAVTPIGARPNPSAAGGDPPLNEEK